MASVSCSLAVLNFTQVAGHRKVPQLGTGEITCRASSIPRGHRISHGPQHCVNCGNTKAPGLLTRWSGLSAHSAHLNRTAHSANSAGSGLGCKLVSRNCNPLHRKRGTSGTLGTSGTFGTFRTLQSVQCRGRKGLQRDCVLGAVDAAGGTGHQRRRSAAARASAASFSTGVEEVAASSRAAEGAQFQPPKPLPTAPKTTSMSAVLTYLSQLAADESSLRWRIVVALLLLVAGKAAGLAGPLLFKRGLDELAGKAAAAGAAGVAPGVVVRTAITALVLSAASKAVSAVSSELRNIVFTPVGQATARRVEYHFFAHILGMDMAFHLERKTGALARIIERGKRSITMMFRAVVFTFVPATVELLLVCGLLARHVSAAFSGVVMLTFVAYVAWTIALTKASVARRKEVNQLDNLTTGKAVDVLLNYETVVQFNNQKLDLTQYDKLLVDYQKSIVNLEVISAALNGGQSTILAIGLAAVMAMAGLQVARGTMTVGDLVLVNGLVLQLSLPLQFLGFQYRDLRQSLVDMDQMFSMLSTESSMKPGSEVLTWRREGVAVDVRDVHFGYSDTRPILRGVTVTAEPGQSVALVGPSGSGKSTIVKLLLRLYDPSQGSLHLDGHDVRDLTLDSLRGSAAVVPQDTVLFNDTIYYNIAYGRPGAMREDVERAAKQARMHEAIMRMPDGYNTLVGERGLKLSGGEKQRVAIARAFLKEPRLLICDEATSALDSATEAAILSSLKELAQGRTCLFVAHRLSTIKHCDSIMVMEAGQVVEQGTHASLLAKKGGRYATMWALQESERPRGPSSSPAEAAGEGAGVTAGAPAGVNGAHRAAAAEEDEPESGRGARGSRGEAMQEAVVDGGEVAGGAEGEASYGPCVDEMRQAQRCMHDALGGESSGSDEDGHRHGREPSVSKSGGGVAHQVVRVEE